MKAKRVILVVLCLLFAAVITAGLISIKNKDKVAEIAQNQPAAALKESESQAAPEKAEGEKQEKEPDTEVHTVEAEQEAPSDSSTDTESAAQQESKKGKREKPNQKTDADFDDAGSETVKPTAKPVQAETAVAPAVTEAVKQSETTNDKTEKPKEEPEPENSGASLDNQPKPATATDDMGFLISANTKHDIVEKSEGKFSLDDITNVLLIGVDNDNLAGMNARGNADGTMLVSINNKTKQLTLTSFMRDTKIRQPGEYEKKITTVYHDAGAKKLVEAIELNFGVYVNDYILVNYLDVMNIVDLLGGLDIELSADEIYNINGKIPSIEILAGVPTGSNYIPQNQPGKLHLNGIQTAAYLRIRPASTNYDSGRTERARKIVTLMLEKVKDMSTSKKASFADKVLPMIETDMTDSEILKFSESASEFMNFDLYSAKIPLDGTYANSTDGNMFILPDFEINNKYLYESIYEGKH